LIGPELVAKQFTGCHLLLEHLLDKQIWLVDHKASSMWRPRRNVAQAIVFHFLQNIVQLGGERSIGLRVHGAVACTGCSRYFRIVTVHGRVNDHAGARHICFAGIVVRCRAEVTQKPM
jgi:hypothetical protein